VGCVNTLPPLFTAQIFLLLPLSELTKWRCDAKMKQPIRTRIDLFRKQSQQEAITQLLDATAQFECVY